MPNPPSASAGMAAGLGIGPLHPSMHGHISVGWVRWRDGEIYPERSVLDSCYSRSALHHDQQANTRRLPLLTLAPRMPLPQKFTLDLQRGTGFQEHIEVLPSTPISLHHLCCTSWKQRNRSELTSVDGNIFIYAMHDCKDTHSSIFFAHFSRESPKQKFWSSPWAGTITSACIWCYYNSLFVFKICSNNVKPKHLWKTFFLLFFWKLSSLR